MAVQKLNIEEFIIKSKGYPILDVRSPGEYLHAHIPGAYSLPIFNDEERAVIGTAYKKMGREVAVKEGILFFSSKMKDMQTLAMEIWAQSGAQGQPVFFVHCWRGGMRSGAVAWLLGLYGYKIYLLEEGYKSFRRWALQQFEKPYHFKILGGFTGSGKTDILKELKSLNQQIIDLEGLANHKGSAFGSLGMPPQPTQEMFENLLVMELWNHSPHDGSIWVEDESRHIGKSHLPGTLWQTMRLSPLYFLNIPQDKRLDYIVREYGVFDKEALKNSVLKIKKRLGGLNTKEAIRFIDEDNIRAAFEILLKYYDKLYGQSLEKHLETGIELHKISSSDVDKKNATLLL